MSWGGFQLAKVYRQGVQIGWGITCGLHKNEGDSIGACCKKQITFGGSGGAAGGALSDTDCIVALKSWLVLGFVLSGNDQRTQHVRLNARKHAQGFTEPELDEVLRGCGYEP